MEFIDLKRQYKKYQEEFDLAIKEVLESGRFILGEPVSILEKKLAAYVGVKHCIATSSGTCSLLLALKALDIGPGDEVITTPLTWVSPVECICRVGATPVFCDVDPKTCILDDTKIEALITEKTKAIMPISLYGGLPNFDNLWRIAEKYGLDIIEDGAQSFGATYEGRKSGSLSKIGTTSFFPTKPLGCYGDGGAVFTDDDQIAEKVRALHTHGANVRFHHEYIGMNGRIDTLQAAILLVKFSYFEEELQMRKMIEEYYTENLSEYFEVIAYDEKIESARALYTLQSDDRESVLNEMKSQNIPYSIYYPIGVHEQPAYQFLGYKRGDFPVAERICRRAFSIPMHPWLQRDEQDSVIQAIKEGLLAVTK